MKKLLKGLIVAIVALVIVSSPVLAQYSATILFRETSGSTYAMFPARTPINTTYLVNNGYITATGLDTRVTSGGTVIPHMLADDKLLFAYPLSASSSNTLTFYTWIVPLTDFYVITGYNGYVMTLDDAAMEPGNNFEFEFDGWVDTTLAANKNLIYKEDAFRTWITGATDITAGIFDNVTPTGTVDALAGWNNEPNAIDNNTVTFADSNAIVAGAWSEFLELTHAAMWTESLSYYVSTSHINVNVIDLDAYYDGAWQDVFQGAFATGAWETHDLADTESVTNMRIRFQNNDVGAQTANIHEGLYNGYLPSVTASGVTTDEHIVNVSATGGGTNLLIIDIDAGAITQNVALAGATVPLNGNDWYFGQNNVLSYYDYYTHTVGGTLIVNYDPATYIVGTVLPDREGAAQDGAITWGVNPTGVSVTFYGLESEEEVTTITTPTASPDVAGDVNTPSGMHLTDTEMTGTEQLFYFFANGVATDTSTPIQFFWWTLCAIAIILGITLGLRYSGSNLWMGGLAGVGMIGICIGMALLPGWVLIVAVLIIIGAAIWERTPAI